MKKVSPGTANEIIKLYLEGISSEKIAHTFNLHATTICRILKRNQIKIRPAAENKRKYKICEDFFEKITTPRQAYFLGLLYADGNLSKSKNDIKITLKDQDILIKFSNLIYNFNNLFIEKDKYHTLVISSQKMHHDLIKLGCIPNKSLILTFPKNLFDESLYSHFIRGYFDGDGCICLYPSGRATIDITSTSFFLVELIKILNDKLQIKITNLYRRHPERNTSTRNIQFSSQKNIVKFMNWIYQDCGEYYLNRKHEKYKLFLERNKV